MALTPLPAALDQLLTNLQPLTEAQCLPLSDCLGRVLADDILAALDVPPFDNSAMDGYAVRIEDLPGELPVSQRIPAGAPAAPLQPGSVARIFTGAVIPEGANAVVMQEDAIERDGKVQILGCLSPGSHIRRRGADVPVGSVVLPRGQILGPQDLGVAASVGLAELPVRRPLRVAVMTTGDELVPPGQPREGWQIYDSNAAQISGQLRLLGMAPVEFASLPDDPSLIGDALEQAAGSVDCIITSGGISVGEEDHVRHQIEARGQLNLWKLAIKPGKPLAFGAVAGCPVFGLPGNPVSSWMTFGLVVKPWLLRAQGAQVPPMRRLTAVADFELDRPGSREEFLRVVLDNAQLPTASLTGDQSSGVLTSASRAGGLAIVPIGATVKRGDQVQVLPLSEFLSPHTAG